MSIALLTWNRADEVLHCLESLGVRDVADDVPIVLLVNGSEDGTAARVRQAYPEVEVHESPVNLGCPAGRNRLVELCPTDWVVFVDDDGTAPPGFLDVALGEIGAATPQVGVVAGYMVDPVLAPDMRLTSGPAGTFCAGVCAVRRDVFLRLGGFHEDGLRQGEEGEFSIKLYDAGMTIQRATDLILHHPSGLDAAKRRHLLRTGLRQSLLTGAKLCPAWLLPIWTVWKLLVNLRVAVRLRAWRSYVAGLRDVAHALPATWRTRRPASTRAVLATRGRLPHLVRVIRTGIDR